MPTALAARVRRDRREVALALAATVTALEELVEVGRQEVRAFVAGGFLGQLIQASQVEVLANAIRHCIEALMKLFLAPEDAKLRIEGVNGATVDSRNRDAGTSPEVAGRDGDHVSGSDHRVQEVVDRRRIMKTGNGVIPERRRLLGWTADVAAPTAALRQKRTIGGWKCHTDGCFDGADVTLGSIPKRRAAEFSQATGVTHVHLSFSVSDRLAVRLDLQVACPPPRISPRTSDRILLRKVRGNEQAREIEGSFSVCQQPFQANLPVVLPKADHATGRKFALFGPCMAVRWQRSGVR